MALKSTININVDFYDKKYTLINAKQLDRSSRFISVTCYNHGKLCPVNVNEHAVYIRYRKPDNYSVFRFCEIDDNGKIIIELTEQMLASDGVCQADLVIVNKGDAKVDAETGEIVAINNASILSTMTFYIDVLESAVKNSNIVSDYELDALNTMLTRAEAEYKEVILTAKSYAIGDAGGIRENEDYDNAKYYFEQSSNNVIDSATSALNAANSESLAEEHMQDAQRYCEVVKSVVNGLNSGFIPIGTVSFSELATAEKATGFTYNISDDFVTDESFAEGSGKSYTAGTNVYCRSDGMWDCLGGSASLAATVDEVINYLGIKG